MSLTLGQWLQALVPVPAALADLPITEMAIDSRRVTTGSVFCAYPGEQQDGRDYLSQACAQGAALLLYDPLDYQPSRLTVPQLAVPQLRQQVSLLASRLYGQPSQELSVIGITGTNGKTSCSHFLAQAYQQQGQACAVMGTLGNGLLDELAPSNLTTPDPLHVQALLAEWQAQSVSQVAMEVSAHAMSQQRVAAVRFAAVLLTNLSQDHLDYYGDMVTYAAAKRQLFVQAQQQGALMVINADDVFGQALLVEYDHADHCLSYGWAATAQVRVRQLDWRDQGFRAQVSSPWGDACLSCDLLGDYNVANVLAVFTLLCGLGMSVADAVQALASLQAPAGRLQQLSVRGLPRVVVDYAHTPDALQQLLQTLRGQCQGQLWCVFGCGGNRDASKRLLMGQIADQLSDQLVLTDDNPRHEPSQQILQQIAAGVQNTPYICIADRRQAIKHAITQASANDWVVIAGKGHESYQQYGDLRQPFNDAEVAQQILAEVAA